MVEKRFLVISCFVLTCFLVTGCKPSVGSQAHMGSRTYGYFKTHYQDESQFIVETIAADLAEQIYYAKFHRLPGSEYPNVAAVESPGSSFGTPTYELHIDLDKQHRGLKLRLEINGPIWSPEVYDGLAASLASAVGLRAGVSNSSDDTELLAKLTDGMATTIEKENERLSQSLENDFSDPVLHEQAAVLLGAFTLREHSGDFFEIRSPLCRITAHLAMARYLNGHKPLGVNGQMAGAMLLTLMNDEAAALEKLSAIKTNDTASIQWVRALQARNTGDYRPLDKLAGLSGIESIEWFDALDRSANPDTAWNKLSDAQKHTVDFVRIANENEYSVGEGHELLALSLPLEFQEIESVYELSHRKKLTRAELVPALNQMPDRCFSTDSNSQSGVHIIGWGLWAGFLQRQLCAAIEENFDFLQRKWGVPDEAEAFSRKCDQAFGGLRLYPFVRRFNCTDVASYRKSVDDGFKVTVETPELVPARCWNFLCYWFTPNELYKPNPNPHINEWFKHNPPPGTVYDILPRLDHPSLVARPDSQALLQKLHDLAPYNHDLVWYILKTKYHNHPTYAEATNLYGPVLPYAVYAMDAVAKTLQDQPDKYEQLMSKAAKIDPADYFTLGNYFAARGEDDKAADYYQHGKDKCMDSVEAATCAPWMVHYYLKKGQIAAARREADFGADVYSDYGLEAKAEFLEATGDYAGAFQWYSKFEERYDDAGLLVAFCIRYQTNTGDSRYETKEQGQLRKLFPDGIEKVGLSNFHSPPTDGVVINEATDLAKAAGLSVGDVIVAVYGVRVHNFTQYCCARNISLSSKMVLIVWHGGKYDEIQAHPPNHHFGGEFADYRPR